MSATQKEGGCGTSGGWTRHQVLVYTLIYLAALLLLGVVLWVLPTTFLLGSKIKRLPFWNSVIHAPVKETVYYLLPYLLIWVILSIIGQALFCSLTNRMTLRLFHVVAILLWLGVAFALFGNAHVYHDLHEGATPTILQIVSMDAIKLSFANSPARFIQSGGLFAVFALEMYVAHRSYRQNLLLCRLSSFRQSILSLFLWIPWVVVPATVTHAVHNMLIYMLGELS